MTGPRQDNATLTEELLAAADELEAAALLPAEESTYRRQAALIRALVAEHAPSDSPIFADADVCKADVEQLPCATIEALADAFLSSRSTVPGVTK